MIGGGCLASFTKDLPVVRQGGSRKPGGRDLVGWPGAWPSTAACVPLPGNDALAPDFPAAASACTACK